MNCQNELWSNCLDGGELGGWVSMIETEWGKKTGSGEENMRFSQRITGDVSVSIYFLQFLYSLFLPMLRCRNIFFFVYNVYRIFSALSLVGPGWVVGALAESDKAQKISRYRWDNKAVKHILFDVGFSITILPPSACKSVCVCANKTTFILYEYNVGLCKHRTFLHIFHAA